jgi:hypothetical protein
LPPPNTQPQQDSCRPGPAQGKPIDFLLVVRACGRAALLSVWPIIVADKGTVWGMMLGAVLRYTLIAEVFGKRPT